MVLQVSDGSAVLPLALEIGQFCKQLVPMYMYVYVAKQSFWDTLHIVTGMRVKLRITATIVCSV